MAKMSVKNDHAKCWLKDEEWEHSYCTGEKLQWWNHSGKSLATSLKKKKTVIYRMTLPLYFQVFMQEKKKEREIFTQRFIETLFVITKN